MPQDIKEVIMADKTTDKGGRHICWRDRKRWLFFGLPFTFTVYSLNEDRLFVKRGFFTIHEDEVRLYRIRDISLRKTLFQRIFGLGTIGICSTDSTLKDFELKNIKKSDAVKEKLSEYVENERQRKRVSTRELMGSHDGPDHMEDFDDIDGFDFEDHDDTDVR